PSHAQPCTILPPFCLTDPSSRYGPVGRNPVSSSNSRIAAARGSSPSSTTPLGIVQAPSSLFLQKGPPGCARKNSTSDPTLRNSSRPALTLGCLAIAVSALPVALRIRLQIFRHSCDLPFAPPAGWRPSAVHV